MAITETARLERETEATRAQLEQTLGELRARMSPGQLVDQATDYFRNSNGRVFLNNLRDEVVYNPLPVALIGAGIAWLALSGAMGKRRGNGRFYSDRDWGQTAAMADDLAHGGGRMSAAQRARRRAESWAGSARESWREGAEDLGERAESMGERMSTAYDETVDRARETARDWTDTAHEWTDQARDTAEDLTDQARSAAQQAKDTIGEGVDEMRERAAHARESATRGVRHAARRAAEYGRSARDAVQPDGALVNFCREQPMLVAGLGVAIGAALAAMIPASRTERRVMGEASRNVQNRVRDVAEQTMQPFTEGGNAEPQERQSAERRSNEPEAAGAATEFDRSVRQGSQSPNVENEPQSAPYAEAAEAGAAGQGTPASGEETTKSH